MVLRPQIIVKENELTSLIAPVGDRVAAMIGTSIWGPLNTVTVIGSMSQYVNTFGDDKTGDGVTGVKGADLFFRNGGSLKFIRIEDGDAAEADYTALITATPAIDFTAKYKGTYGDNIIVTVTANATTAANRDLEITDGKINEVYTNNGAGYATNAAIETDIAANSSLVTAVPRGGQEATIIDAFTATALTGGDDGEDSLIDADFTTAIDNLLLTEDFNFLLIPGETVDAFQTTVVGKLNTRASTEKKYARYITGITVDETIATAVARTSSGKRLSVMAPNVKYTHRIDGTQAVYDGSYLACAYAGLLAQLDLEISGTHETVNVEGLSVLESSGKEFYNKTEQEALLQGSIMPVSNIDGAIQIVRAITRNADQSSVFFEEVVTDIVDETRRQLEEYLNTVLGKPNTEERRAIYTARVDAILTNLVTDGILQEVQPALIEEGASPDTMVVTANVRPAFSTNFVELTININ